MKSINLIWPVSALLLVVAMGIHAVLSFNAANAQIELDILNTARTLRDLLSTMRTFNIQQCPYSDPPLPDPSSESRMHHALPGLPEEVLRFDNMPIVFGLASDLASGPASQEGSHEDKTERELIHWFRANPHREERLIKVQGDREPAFYYYAIPIRAEVACLRCHGAKATVPIAFENQPRFNMGIEPGEPLGIFGMRFPDSQGQALDILLWEQAVQLGGILLMLAFGGLILSRRQARRLQEFTVAALRIGEGDYAARLAKAGSTALVDSFNRMAVAIQNREGTNRESLGRIQALFANMSEGFALNRLIRDERGQPVDFLILEVNGNFEAHTKLHAADVVGRLASEVYGSNEPPCLAAIAQAIDMGAPLRVQCCFASLRRHFEVSISPQGDDEFATLFTDITEHMVAELALGASEARENSIFTAAPVGIGMTINRVIIEANETLFRMTGYSREELIGLSARQLYSSEQEYERVGKVKYAQIRERGIGTVETQWKRKDGSLLEVSLSSSPLDPTNLGKGVTFTAQDISEKRQAEAALRKTKSSSTPWWTGPMTGNIGSTRMAASTT